MTATAESVWDEYYTQQETAQRKAVLKECCCADPENPLNDLRKTLWKLRYENQKTHEENVDMFLWQCVNLLYIYKSSSLAFSRKSSAKEILQLKNNLGFHQAEGYGEEGMEVLYNEWCNAMTRYYISCRQDKCYSKKLFGIMSMQDEEAQKKLTRDAWRLSQGLIQRFKMNDALQPLNKAAKDAYFSLEPKAQTLWEKIEREQAEKAYR